VLQLDPIATLEATIESNPCFELFELSDLFELLELFDLLELFELLENF
jgi:hypothetical protein